jgi:hypothetical protein
MLEASLNIQEDAASCKVIGLVLAPAIWKWVLPNINKEQVTYYLMLFWMEICGIFTVNASINFEVRCEFSYQAYFFTVRGW